MCNLPKSPHAPWPIVVSTNYDQVNPKTRKFGFESVSVNISDRVYYTSCETSVPQKTICLLEERAVFLSLAGNLANTAENYNKKTVCLSKHTFGVENFFEL